MRITCPHCQSDASLVPNRARFEGVLLPRYVVACSGCDRTTAHQDRQELLVAALVGNRHGSGSHELTVAAEGVGHVSFHTDPTGETTPAVEHSELLEYVTSSITAEDTFSLVLRTIETGSNCPSPQGGIPYTAVRGWLVVNGEILALTGQEVWEASCRESDSDTPLDPEADVHYVDADVIPRPYCW